jgi:hypothetical protein
MSAGTIGVSNKVNTSDGRASTVVAITSNDSNHIGGKGVVNRFGGQPIGTQAIIAQNGNYIIAENEDRIITQG